MLFENWRGGNGGIGGTNIKASNGAGLSALFAKGGGVVSADQVKSKLFFLPNNQAMPGSQQPFKYTSEGFGVKSSFLKQYVRGTDMSAIHFERRQYKQGM